MHLSCPFCTSYEVRRLYVVAVDLDSCEYSSCGARWDEDHSTGEYRGRDSHATVVTPPERP